VTQLSAAARRRGCHFQPGDRYQPCPECRACHGGCPECGKVHFPWCPWIPEIDPRRRCDATVCTAKRFCLADPVAVRYTQCPNGHCLPHQFCATHAKPGPGRAECGVCFGDGKPGVTLTVADEHRQFLLI
jgi:hypothetical protein